MTTLQKVVITATLAAAVGTGIYEARQAVNSRTQVEALRQQQSPLSEQIRQLTHERDDANRKFASVQEENERLNRNTSELLKLRAELTRLRGDAKELASSKSDPFVESALAWKARVAELKQRLAQMPDQSIPQLQLLGEEDWFDVVKHLKLDTEVGFRRALGRLRGKARGDVSGLMSMALVQYVRANGGELPGDIPQLKPYFKAPMDDAILQQYQLLHTGKLNDVPQGQWLINEKTPLEDGFDTTFRVGYDKFGVERSGPLEEALGRFYEANPGQEPTDPSQLLPYVKDPLRK